MNAPTSLPDIQVSVEVKHLPQYSGGSRQLFAYLIRIENISPDSWQLLSRFWRITDALGRETVVEGEGVVGQQPVLPPQGVYVYDSLVTVEAAPARMEGHYIFQDAWGNTGRAEIAPFVLEVPSAGGRVLN